MKNASLIPKFWRLQKIKKWENPNIVLISNSVRRKKVQYYQMQKEKKTQMFKLQTTLAWRQLKGKKEYVIGKFINEDMQQYVHNKLYMHDV